MQGKKPNKAELEWIQAVIELGCIVCRNNGYETPPEIHHLAGSKKPGAHLKTIGLCYLHHRSGIASKDVISRHPFKARFEAEYGNEWDLLKQTRELLSEI